MRKISKWAKNNPKLSKIIIAFSHILVVINAVCLGVLLFISNWGESKWLLAIVANLFFIAYIFYPEKNTEKKQNRYFYIRQKAHDFSLVIFYSIVITFGVNNFLIQNNNSPDLVLQPTAKFIVFKPNSGNQSTNRKKPKLEIKEKIKDLRKQIKQELKGLKKELKKQNEDRDISNLKVLLTFLTMVIAVFLAYLIAILACELFCSGQQGLAWVVLIGGLFVIGWLAVVALKNIFKRGSKKKSMEKN